MGISIPKLDPAQSAKAVDLIHDGICLGSCFFGGILGNIAASLLWEGGKWLIAPLLEKVPALAELFAKGGKNGNHDLLRALRRAESRALTDLCDKCLEVNLKRKPVRGSVFPLIKESIADDSNGEIAAVCRIRKHFADIYETLPEWPVEKLGNVEKGQMLDIPSLITAGNEVCNVPNLESLRSRVVKNFIETLEREVRMEPGESPLRAVKKKILSPAGIPQILRTEIERSEGGWFDLLRLAFRQELKTNELARIAFQLDCQSELPQLLGRNFDELNRRLDVIDHNLNRIASEMADLYELFDAAFRLLVEHGPLLFDLVEDTHKHVLAIQDALERNSVFGPLPEPIHLVGRGTDLDWVVSQILVPSKKPVLIAGGPGLGKTSLAVNVLHDERIYNEFKGLRMFVAGESIANARVLQEVIQKQFRDVERQSSRGRTDRCLIVIDNFETAWFGVENALPELDSNAPAESTLRNRDELMDAVTHFCRNGDVVLLTIRSGMISDGGWGRVIELDGLSKKECRVVFKQFSSDSHWDEHEIDQLTQFTGGVPLAFRIACQLARRYESVERLLEALRIGGLSALIHNQETGIRGVKNRYSSVAACVDLSLKHLAVDSGTDARRLLALLAWLPSGVDKLDLAEKYPWSNDALILLQEIGLLQTGGRVWKLLPPIRERCREADHDLLPEASDANPFIEECLAGIEACKNRVGHEGGEEVLETVKTQSGNWEELLRLHGRLHQRTDRYLDALEIWCDFARFSGFGGAAPIYSAIEWCGNWLSEAELGKLFYLAGMIIIDRGDNDQAKKEFENALKIFREGNVTWGRANATFRIGEMALYRGDLENAEILVKEAESLYTDDEKNGKANCLRTLGTLCLKRRQWKEAEAYYADAKTEYAKAPSHQRGLANCSLRMSDALKERGLLENADEELRTAYRIFKNCGAKLWEGGALLRMGDLALKKCDWKRAKQNYTEAGEILRLVSNLPGQGWAERGLAEIALEELKDELGKKSPESGIENEVSFEIKEMAQEARNRLGKARSLYERALNLGEQAKVVRLLGRTSRLEGRRDQASSEFKHAIALFEFTDDSRAVEETRQELAECNRD